MGKKIFERKNFFAESNKHLKHTKGDGKKKFRRNNFDRIENRFCSYEVFWNSNFMICWALA